MIFFTKLLLEDKVRFYDNNGVRKEVDVNKLYGFCRKGAIFVNYGDDFCRIPVIGNICHFTANITVYEDRYMRNVYNYGYYNVPTTTTRTEIRQYLLHFQSGHVLEYSAENIELILEADKELYKEFMDLPRRKKKQLKFVYLRKYNDRNPLYIPIN